MNLSLLVLLVGVIACTFTNRWNGVLASAKTVPQVLHLDLWPRLGGSCGMQLLLLLNLSIPRKVPDRKFNYYIRNNLIIYLLWPLVLSA